MYIDSSCTNLGTDIEMSVLHVGPAIIDPNEGCWVAAWTFLLTHIIPRTGDKLKRTAKKSFHVFSFDDTEEKVAVRFEGEKDQDAIYDITLCKYLNSDNELPIGQDIRFLCVAHPVWKFRKDHGILQNENCLKIILKGPRSADPF